MYRSYRRLLVGVLALLSLLFNVFLSIASIPSKAQSNQIVLSVALRDGMRSPVKDAVISFEKDHPDIKVNIVAEDVDEELAVNNLEKHLKAAEQLVRSADVAFVSQFTLSLESTAAGYFLDLKPLIQQDSTLNEDSYIPIAWNSMQWNGGIWAIPSTVSADLLIYDQAAFDATGLPYPNEQWTIDDLDNAVRKLTKYDASGKVIRPGLAFITPLDEARLIRSLISAESFQAGIIPHFADYEGLEHNLSVLAKLKADGLVGNRPESAAISTCCMYRLFAQNNRKHQWNVALLPGGHSVVTVQGFAVSAGTQYPEQAYALARSLSETPTIQKYFADTISAYKPNSVNATPAFKALPVETAKLWLQAINDGITQSEFQYFSHIIPAFDKIAAGEDIATALNSAEQHGIDALQQAARHKSASAITVATPIPELSLQPDEIALKFGLAFTTGFNQVPNKELWDNLIKDFINTDQKIKSITLDLTPNPTINDDDCFYSLATAANGAQLSRYYYNLDPFISTDNDFDKADLLQGVLAVATADNKLWAFPLTLEPMVLNYDAEALEKAGIAPPEPMWTVSAFADALRQLRPDANAAPIMAAPVDAGNGTHLLLLIAAYGGLPLDFRYEPPAVNYIDPTTVEAIQQVLNLVKQGYIQYSRLGDPTAMIPPAALNTPIRIQMLNTLAIGLKASKTNTSSGKVMLFPSGTRQQAIAFDIGAAYISNKTPHPDACYRWIKAIAGHPELFNAMPVTYSALNAPALEAAQGHEIVNIYKQVADLLKNPDTVTMPLTGRSFAAYIPLLLLYRVFDSYVLDNADLQSALKEAELKSKAFQECFKSIAPYDPTDPKGGQVYLNDISRCVGSAEPALAELFASQ